MPHKITVIQTGLDTTKDLKEKNAMPYKITETDWHIHEHKPKTWYNVIHDHCLTDWKV